MSKIRRVIDLNTEVVLDDEGQWAARFGVDGVHEIEADVRAWASTVRAQALAANSIEATVR